MRTSQGTISQAKTLQSGDVAERASQPEAVSNERGDLAEPAPVDGLAVDSASVSPNSPIIVAAKEQSKLMSISNWLQLPELSPEKYAQMVEMRTAPARVKYTVKHPRETVKPINSMLDELQGNSPEALLRRWLAM